MERMACRAFSTFIKTQQALELQKIAKCRYKKSIFVSVEHWKRLIYGHTVEMEAVKKNFVLERIGKEYEGSVGCVAALTERDRHRAG